MKFTLVAAIASLASVAFAQGTPEVPACAATCYFGTAIGSSGCGETDIPCLCSSQKYLTEVFSCLAASCVGGDQEAAIATGVALCGTAGVTIDPAAIAAGAGSGASSEASNAATTSSASGTVSPASTASPASDSTSAPTSAPTSATEHSSAGSVVASVIGVVGGLAVALAL